MKLINIKYKESSAIFRKILKILTYLILTIVILLLSGLTYFYINRDEIGRDLLLKLNEIQNGEIIFEKIALAPFAQFPKISLSLVNVSYFENKEASKDNKENPICELTNIYLAFNLIDLLDGNINVTNITLKSGHVRILTYPDTTINFLNAIASTKDQEPEDEISIEEEDTVKTANELEHFLMIKNLTIKNVMMEFENRVFERKTSFHVNNFTASFSHKAKRNKLKLAGDLELEFYQLEGVTLLRDKSIQLAVDLLYHGKEKLINIKPSDIIFEGARFDIAGLVDMNDDGEMNFQIKLADKDFSLLSLVFKEDVIYQNRKNLLKGDFYFEANVRGKTYNEIPFIDLTFGVKNVNLHMPKVGKSIKDLDFDAYLTTGKKRDFSEAYFKLKNFSAQLPDGNTRCTLTLKNIKKPFINLDWYLKTDLSGFSDLFKIDFIDNLNGTITVDAEMKGVVDSELGTIVDEKTKASLTFEDVSLRFPDVISLDKINGVIKRENKNLRLEEFQVITENTDVTLNGIINNILFLPFNIESDITADITLVSDIFDLPRVFAFDPSVGRSFNHIIKELDLKVTAKTTTAKLLNFDDFPDIDFDISLLDAAFDDFPDMKIKKSDINFYEDTSGFNIQFDHLNIHTANGELTLKGAYNGSEWKPYYLISDTKAKNIHMLYLLNQFEMDLDSTSFFNSILNGSFDVKLEFPKDSLIFKTLRMADADLLIYYLAENDTVISRSLTINLNNVYWDSDIDSNPMATLTTSGIIDAERFRTNSFDVDNLKFDVSVNNGLYKITPNSESFFRTKGEGVFIAQPWSKIPSYRFKYAVEQFAIEDWLASFLEDPVVNGMMSFSIDVQMIGDNWDNLIKELNGSIYSEGKDLRLHGLNVDEVLKKIERSRNFTLLDVGAVLFAGPVGLAVTKGSDLAVLFASNPGEVTHIPKLVSSWEISKGILKIKDVAFATNKNRIAAIGHVNVADKTLNITFAVLNEDGSSRLNQNIYGNLDNPKLGEIKVIKTLLVPVTNLFNSILSIQGETFYEGSVKHPE